jgi:hypothetical protein
MNGAGDQWRELCIAAAFEDNPERLKELVSEIRDRLFERQEVLTDRMFQRLASEPPVSPKEKHWIH